MTWTQFLLYFVLPYLGGSAAGFLIFMAISPVIDRWVFNERARDDHA